MRLSHDKNSWQRWLFPILIVLATTWTYWPVLHHQFVSLDDELTVYENRLVTQASFSTFCSFWAAPYQGLYAPLSYSLLIALAMISRTLPLSAVQKPFPFSATPFHAADLILHVLNALLVYRLVGRFIPRRWAAAGALLFALHPLQVESVAWVSETSNLLVALFSMLAIDLYLSSALHDSPHLAAALAGRFERVNSGTPALAESASQARPLNSDPPPAIPGQDAGARQRKATFYLATEIYLLALASKALAVMTPVLAMILLWLSLGGRERVNTGHRIRKYLPPGLMLWFLMAIPFAIVAKNAQPVPEHWVQAPIWFRPFVAADSIAFYLRKLAFPVRLLTDYDRSPAVLRASGWWRHTWVLPVALALVVGWIGRRRRNRALAAAALWFVAAMLPVLGLTLFVFQHSSTVADRYVYLPMFGVALAVAWGLNRLAAFGKPGLWRRMSAAIAVAVAIAALSAAALRTRHQLHYWQDSATLFAYTKQEIGRLPGVKQSEGAPPWALSGPPSPAAPAASAPPTTQPGAASRPQ